MLRLLAVIALSCTSLGCGPRATHPMQWREVTSAPVGRFEPLGVEVGGKMYVFGGFLTADTVSTRVDVFDPVAETWTQLGDMPAPQTHAGVAVEGATVHVVGGFLGFPSPSQRSHFRYDTTTDGWEQLADLPAPMSGHALLRVGDRLHAIGGLDAIGRGVVGDHRIFDLATSAWTEAPPLPEPRDHLGGAVVDGRIHVVGGRHGWDEIYGHLGALDVFDPATGTWSAAEPLPEPRSEISYATLEAGGLMLTVGGSTPFVQPSDEVWAFDPRTGAWELFDHMPGRRKGVVAIKVGNQLVVAHGSPSSTDPVGTTWIACCLP